jgi:hypothetical protein
MTRGKNLVEMLKFCSGMPHESVVHLEFGKKIFRYDPKKSWFTEVTVLDEGEEIDREVRPVSDAEEIPVSGWVEVEPLRKKRSLIPLGPVKLKIPRLDNRKVRVGGRIPSLLKATALLPKTVTVQEPVESEPHVIEQSLEAIEITALPKHVPVKVIPTPATRRTRLPKAEMEPAEPSKPLKVIRRRREQAPKVFETPSGTFPKAMLEGISAESDESGELQTE